MEIIRWYVSSWFTVYLRGIMTLNCHHGSSEHSMTQKATEDPATSQAVIKSTSASSRDGAGLDKFPAHQRPPSAGA